MVYGAGVCWNLCNRFIVQSLWNLTGFWVALIPRCFTNYKAIWLFKLQILQLRDFTRVLRQSVLWYWNGTIVSLIHKELNLAIPEFGAHEQCRLWHHQAVRSGQVAVKLTLVEETENNIYSGGNGSTFQRSFSMFSGQEEYSWYFIIVVAKRLSAA